MKYQKLNFLLPVIIGLAACTGNGSTSQEAVIPADDSRSTGQLLYESKCAVCHGNDGTAAIGGAANLQLSTIDAATAIQTITNGKGAMPAFKENLQGDGITQVADYIKTLRK